MQIESTISIFGDIVFTIFNDLHILFTFQTVTMYEIMRHRSEKMDFV